jgi:hypothetical protein
MRHVIITKYEMVNFNPAVAKHMPLEHQIIMADALMRQWIEQKLAVAGFDLYEPFEVRDRDDLGAIEYRQPQPTKEKSDD